MTKGAKRNLVFHELNINKQKKTIENSNKKVVFLCRVGVSEIANSKFEHNRAVIIWAALEEEVRNFEHALVLYVGDHLSAHVLQDPGSVDHKVGDLYQCAIQIVNHT